MTNYGKINIGQLTINEGRTLLDVELRTRAGGEKEKIKPHKPKLILKQQAYLICDKKSFGEGTIVLSHSHSKV